MAKKKEVKKEMLSSYEETPTEKFIRMANEVHGDYYDYSKVNYINSRTKVCIICPNHGEFFARPDTHLKGCVCKKCQFENQKRVIFGKAYKIWKHMLSRCYSEDFKSKNHTYKNCESCDEWLLFSNFKQWFDEHYIDGWQLDKDILIKGNKVYSPETCCFVPQHINGMLVKSDKRRGKYLIGVTRHGTGYRAMIRINRVHNNLGTFRTEQEAFNVYKKKKEEAIKELSDEYKEMLDPKVYEALYNYQVEITD